MRVAGVVLCLCIVAFVGASLFPAFPTPAFFWAGNNFFDGQSESLETYHSDVVTDFVIKASNQETGNVLSKFVKNSQPLEAIVLFIDPKPALSNEFYSFLQPILSQSSSLVLPYLYKSQSISTTSQDILYAFEQKIIVSNTQAGAIPREQLVQHLANNAAIFSNGETDVIAIYLEKEADRATFVANVNNAIKAQTADYLALYIADTDYVREEESNHGSKREVEARDAGKYANSTYWPRGVWEGLLSTILLLFILTVGIWCTAELQTPSKWEKPKVVHHGH